MNLREAAQQALEALQIWQDSLTDPSAIPGWRFFVVGEKAIANLRAALSDHVADTSKTSDHIADANKMVATSQEFRQVEPVAWITPGQDLHLVNHEGFQDWTPLYTAPPQHAQTWTDEHWTEYERGIVATERERIAAWVEDMCADLDAKTIANGIRNGGNDDIRAFEVRNDQD